MNVRWCAEVASRKPVCDVLQMATNRCSTVPCGLPFQNSGCARVLEEGAYAPMATTVDQAPQPRAKRSWKRWVSLRAYGLVTSSLFGATTSPLTMRARFERLSRVSRGKLQRKFPRLLFKDYAIDELAIESIRAVEAPTRVILYLH